MVFHLVAGEPGRMSHIVGQLVKVELVKSLCPLDYAKEVSLVISYNE